MSHATNLNLDAVPKSDFSSSAAITKCQICTMDSCGPSNALQNLNKHSQRDNSLQNELQFKNRPAEVSRFKKGQLFDKNLNNQFNQFNETNMNNDFAANFMNQFKGVNPSTRAQNQGWINDFDNLSLNSGMVNQPNLNVQQFNQFNNSQNHAQIPQNQGHTQQFNQHQASGNYNQYSQYNQRSFPLNMRTNLSTPLQPPEHSEIHQYEQNIDKQFELMENELKDLEQEAQGQNLEHNHEEFAKIAKNVENSMLKAFENNSNNPELLDKLKNSEFLNLMGKVGNRNVELKGEEFVENQNPTSTIRDSHNENINYHHARYDFDKNSHHDNTQDFNDVNANNLSRPDLRDYTSEEPLQQSEPRPDQENKLPDPLAHIKDGQLSDISDPLMMAQIISGGQVKSKDWLDADTDWMDSDYIPKSQRNRPLKRSIMTEHEQQVFDDYRNDDDFY